MDRCRLRFATWVLATAMCLVVGPVSSVAAAPKSVLILSEGPGLPNAVLVRDRIVAELQQDVVVPNIYEEALDTIRFRNEGYDRQLAALYRAKYSNETFALVIVLSEPALDFALRHRDDLFPRATLLFGAIDHRVLRGRDLGANVTGLFLGMEAQATIDVALALHPGRRKILVVGGMSRLDRKWLEAIAEDMRAVASQADFTYMTEHSMEEVLAAARALGDDGLVFLVSISADAKGVSRSGPEMTAALRQAASVPIYGMSNSFLGHGIVGGVLIDMPGHGTELGQRARQILAGEPAANVPIMTTPSVLSFDWRELKRFGVDDVPLPAGATVVNREPGIWDVYQRTILVTGAVLVGQSLLIGGLLVQRRRRRRAERDLRDRQDALLQSQSRYTLATAAGAVGLWDWNLETSEIYVDPTLKLILGFADTEIANRADDWGSRVHPEDVARVTAETQACIEGRINEYEVEHRMIHKDGSVRWFLSRGSLVRRDDGSPHRMVGTKVDITQRKQAEEAIRENEAVLKASHQEIQHLAGRLIAAQEVERARIARDLHDDLSQQVAGLSIALSALKRRLAALPGAGDLRGEAASLQQRAIALAENIRDLSHDLHPTVLAHAGLVPALNGYCAEIQRRHAIVVTFTTDGDFASTAADSALCVYRVAQEALRNVVTHAGARHVDVRLIRCGDRAELTIADDGRGFDVVQASKGVRGLGLISINERVRLAGGTVSIVTELHKGTRVRVQVPTRSPATSPAAGVSGPYATSA